MAGAVSGVGAFKVVHRAGSANQNADSLSRLATNELLLERGNGV